MDKITFQNAWKAGKFGLDGVISRFGGYFLAILFLAWFWAISAWGQTPGVKYPDPKLTPGEIDTTVTKEMICKSGYTAKVRLVTEETKKEVFARYKIPYVKGKMGQWEVDHFFPLECGGKNLITNLWCQPIKEARLKDHYVENDLHCRICNGEITTQQAFDLITKDWYDYYMKHKGNQCSKK